MESGSCLVLAITTLSLKMVRASIFSTSSSIDEMWVNAPLGHMNFGKYAYKDATGYNLDNQALVFQLQLPSNASPS